MTVQALRARSVGELVDATFTLYRKDAPTYIMVAALASVPGLIAQLLFLGDGGIGQAMATIVSALMSMVTYSLMTGVIIRVGSDVYLGGSVDVQTAVREVLPRVGTLILVAIIKAFVLFFGALFLGVGLFYAGSRWFAPEAAVVLENKNSSGSFSRCSELSNGRKWHIFRTLLLGYGIYFLLMIGVVAVTAVFESELVGLVTQTLFGVIGYPVIALLMMMLYYDMRIRGEGFDVEHLSSALGRVPAT
ncbi:MAG: hypothetical protein ACKVS7_12870 [Gemmatimonadaceae bacterium]